MMGIKKRLTKRRNLFQEKCEAQPSIILLSVPVLLILYRYYGSSEFFDRNIIHFFHGNTFPSLYSILYSFFSSFFSMLIVPVIFIKVILKKRVSEFGGQWGRRKAGLAIIGIIFPIIALMFLPPVSRLPAFQSEYPLFHQAGEKLSLLILYEIFYGFYYLGWEFFFRGYMLFGLKNAFGAANSILIQTIPSTLMHIGKPDGEIFASILAGIVFGVVALKTKSFAYVFLLHWLIGVTLDVFIILSTGRFA